MKWLTVTVCAVLVFLVSGQTTTTEPPQTTTPEPPQTEMPEPAILVEITQGSVTGTRATDGDYFQFLGIPYADSTSGIHRFKAPRPPPSFKDIFVADRKDVKCVRALGVGYEGTEDCLVADIYTPTLDRARHFSVMVWIKGKEFDKVTDYEMSFKNFMKEDVVVVSLNFRESILGFLCLGTEIAPGNAGLKDIIAGLRWIKENIEEFGGNPNDITLFGHGSGAAAVDLITLSPMANGLVDKAIAQSGNAMAPWAMSRDNLEYAVRVAEALGHVITDIEQLSEIFARTSIAALMGVINELDLTENALAFGPCVEREELEGVEPFLVKTPTEILASGNFLQIPFIMGFVDNEGTIRAKEAVEDEWLERMDESFDDFLQSDLKFDSRQERSEVAQRIRQNYFEDDPIDMSTIGDYIAYHGETMVLVSSLREARARAQATSAPLYVYQFSYKGAIGEPFVGPIEVESASHSEELAYMFNASPEGASERDLTIGQILVERWTSFARTYFPESKTSTIDWKPYTAENDYYLRILASDEILDRDDSSLEICIQDPHPETLSFWDEIYKDHFLDAESNWDIIVRDEDENEPEGDGDGDEGDDGNGDGNEGDNGDEDNGDGDNGGDQGDNGSGDGSGDGAASIAAGYTFIIVTIFSLLSQLHSVQLIS